MVSIWHDDETPGYDKGKRDTTFTKWRVLVMDRIAELTGKDQDDAVERLHMHGLAALSVDFEAGKTAEELAQQLSK